MADEHPFIKQVRKLHDIPEDADFLRAVAPKFATATPAERQRDLAAFDAAQQWDKGTRREVQLANLRRRLREIDRNVKSTGQ